ncbi:MAG: hypothetical protein HYR72_00675 [Deltaproteobacteria bacterium]|nr:hypothetical protein [Deltaproteobacteria bacterium]MBI3389456.1 hypothetical protein [Deltaproteobacteria bacterium]
MADEHQPAVPIAIEQVIARLSELEIVLGEPARAAIPAVRARLIEAMAARDRGDAPAALARVGLAMDNLAALADRLDPAEAMLMRAVAQRFRAALAQGDESTAKQAAADMFAQSGAREFKKP